MTAAQKIIETLKSDLKSSLPKSNPVYLQLVEIFPLQEITSATQHKLALMVIEKLIVLTNDDKKIDPAIQTFMTTLANLISDFERSEYKTVKISGSDMLAYLMDLQGLKQADLATELGGQPIVSSILNGTRDLNLRQIKALAKRFKVSADVFI